MLSVQVMENIAGLMHSPSTTVSQLHAERNKGTSLQNLITKDNREVCSLDLGVWMHLP